MVQDNHIYGLIQLEHVTSKLRGDGYWVLISGTSCWRNIPCVFPALRPYAHTNRWAGTEGNVLNVISLFLTLPAWSRLKSSSASVLSFINISADAPQVDQGCVIGECFYLQSHSCSSCSSWQVPSEWVWKLEEKRNVLMAEGAECGSGGLDPLLVFLRKSCTNVP